MVQYFPNPASDYLVIENIETDEIIQVFNVNDQIILPKRLLAAS
jgi:hypothetical protein